MLAPTLGIILRMRAPALPTGLSTALLVLAGLALAPDADAQDPSRDLPAKRVPGVTAEKALELGLARLRAGWHWEAARMFRELMVVDETKPLPHLLMALAMRDVPNRAARHCFDALARREAACPSEQLLLDAYQAYFAVTNQPELNDSRFQKVPGRDRAEALVKALANALAKINALGKIKGEQATASLAGQLAAIESLQTQALNGDTVAHAGASWQRLLLSHHNTFVQTFDEMPFMVPGYHRVASKGSGPSPQLRVLARIPRHPHHSVTHRIGGVLPGFSYPADSTRTAWQPRKATGFELPRGMGGKAKLSDYSDKPVLVVFFLGFGCAHCVAQLADLDPKVPNFRDAGIEVVTIGTDDLNQVRAARQAADENGVDPLHFDVLCDPKGEVFKQWGVWDEFSNEALHGSFLVDAKGRILWQDISVRPFEESDWLLAESKRLLQAWK